MRIPKNIDFFIFDLGNVIIDIDYDFSINELKKILPENKHELSGKFFTSKYHKDYEKGLISSEEFRNEIRNLYQEDWTDVQIDHVWNSLLKNVPQERIDLLKKLKSDYGTAILSNTNAIHIQKFDEILVELTTEKTIFDLCHEIFLSHEMGLAKPDVAIYEEVLGKIKVPAKNVLFFDDLTANLEGAEKVGIQTHQITHPMGLMEFFDLY
ncbi:HAD family hydrolase [Cecembia rubra]|uniref:Putative hydrolase of the HAD superfamily n=2 Tax=Cecembia rubra TaxID=1485585 RepID=A0A2P8EE12_9BACT|nr:HAD family phosphatase [Cecembia rubra]PSL07683.1 putative hydrolase of the HAD superfamily [Cecembia rubra]